MRFCHLDEISVLEPGDKIVARKHLSGEEDYLRDHFPRFAVMPGVLMLESLYQAGMHLVRATVEHQHGLVLLRSAKNVKFSDFVRPGQCLDIEASILKRDGLSFTLKAVGSKEGVQAVSGRLVIECIENLKKTGNHDVVDQLAAKFMRQMSERLQQAAMA